MNTPRVVEEDDEDAIEAALEPRKRSGEPNGD
jgi:hypothetical protein